MLPDEIFENAIGIGQRVGHVHLDTPVAVAAMECRKPLDLADDIAARRYERSHTGSARRFCFRHTREAEKSA
jgi:hypothetical protein